MGRCRSKSRHRRASRHQDRTKPQSTWCARVLAVGTTPRVEGSDYVFPGRKPTKPLVEISRLWYAVRDAATLNDVRLHDLRHSFASVSASSGASLLMIGRLLGHRDTATTAKYEHLLKDPQSQSVIYVGAA